MGKVMARLGGDGRAHEQRIFACFAAILGPTFRGRAEADALRGQTLFVRVCSSALAHELVLLRREIVERLSAEVGPGLVTDIRTRVGRLGA